MCSDQIFPYSSFCYILPIYPDPHPFFLSLIRKQVTSRASVIFQPLVLGPWGSSTTWLTGWQEWRLS